MATINASGTEAVFQIKQWFGLNQNPDGDTKLKMGEASVMRNFMVTRDGNLRKRPGSRRLYSFGEGRISGMWSGTVLGSEIVSVTHGNKAYIVYNGRWLEAPQEIGEFDTAPDSVFMYGFADKLWFLTGTKLYSWDGDSFEVPVGYRPLVAITVPPVGGGTTLEGINKLNGLRRVWFSPDGEAKDFVLPERELESIDGVRLAVNGSFVPTTAYTADLVNGKLTFTDTPQKGVNTLEVEYSVPHDFSSQVFSMRFAETYNGNQDSRVFLYGDGTNKTIYSGVDYWGAQRGDYFPDLNEMSVGSQNTPVTAMVRQSGAMIVFKSDSTYCVSTGTITGADGLDIDAFYVKPVNKAIGNEAYGQAQLVLNYPRTLFGADVYEWKNSASFSSGLTYDERQARRISDRVNSKLRDFRLSDCITFDDNYNQHYYIVYGREALVHNYAADAWYEYTNLDIACACAVDGVMYFGTHDGRVMELNSSTLSDEMPDGTHAPIDCYWESGSMSFGQDFKRKHSAMLWLGVKPEAHSEVHVTIETDRANIDTEKVVVRDMFDFGSIDFGAMDFSLSGRPQMERLKLKAKKFVYYKLKLANNTNDSTTTVNSADIRVRFTGFAK